MHGELPDAPAPMIATDLIDEEDIRIHSQAQWTIHNLTI